ncbi:MAG: hypothetical protein MRY74_15140 [Neomegalonema sp.]|nr:hypothetical protein [Neomegalonema sp.]
MSDKTASSPVGEPPVSQLPAPAELRGAGEVERRDPIAPAVLRDEGAAPPTGGRRGGGNGGGDGGGNGPDDGSLPLYGETEPPSRAKRAMRWFKSPSFPILVFLALSWTSTTFGLVRLVSADRGSATIGEALIIGILVFAATVTMKLMLDLLLASRSIIRAGLSLTGYGVLMALSVGFGFAFYWELLEARRQSFDGARVALSETTRELEKGRASLALISAGIKSLAEESAAKSAREEKVGFTCEAGVGPGPGPRREFRRLEAAKFSAAATDVGTRIADEETKIDQLAKRLDALNAVARKGSAGDAEQKAEFARINAAFARFEADFNTFLTAGPLAKLATSYRKDAAAYRDPTFQRTGPDAKGRISTFTCSDLVLAARLDRMAGIIEGVKPVSFKTVRVIEGADATTEAFQRLTTSTATALFFWRWGEDEGGGAPTKGPGGAGPSGEGPGGAPATAKEKLLAAASPKAPTGLQRRDLVPLFTAGVVDLMILVLTLIEGRGSRMTLLHESMDRAARAPMRLRDYVDLSRQISGDPVFELFANYRVSVMGRYYIAAPTSVAADPASQAQDRAISNLLWALRAKGLAKRVFPMVLLSNEKIADQLTRLGSPAGGRESYELWRLDDGFWDEAVDGLYSDARRSTGAQRRVSEVEKV